MGSDQDLRYSVELLSILDKTTLQGMVATDGAVDAVGHKRPGAFGIHGQPASSVGGLDGTPYPEGGRGIPCALVAMMAIRGGIDVIMDDQRRPHNPPDLPQRYESDLKGEGNYHEAMRSEHAYLRNVSMGREFDGLLDAGTVEPV